MKKIIYLPNDNNSLKQFEIIYHEEHLIDFINTKSLQLGAKKVNCLPYPYCNFNKNERISTERIINKGIECHSPLETTCYPDYEEYVQTVKFSNEAPIIKAMVDASKFRETSLPLFKDRNTYTTYMSMFGIIYGGKIYDFLDKGAIKMLSLESFDDNSYDRQLINDFISIFRWKNEEVVSIKTIQEYLDDFNYSIRSFNKDEILLYVNNQFENAKGVAEKNQKVLNLIKRNK